jgi:cell division protein FtsW
MYKGHKNFYKTTLPFLIYLGIPSIILFMQPSTSIVFLLGIVAVIMYLCSNFSLKNLLIILLVCISAAAVYGIVVTKLPACYATGKDGNKTNMCLGGYRMRRIQAFFDPKNESLNETYQPKQAKIGLGSGGIFGVGLGQSRQKYSYLPESFTDSIFAIIGEELGFFGSILIIGLFFLFYFSGLSIVKNAPDAFGSFLSLGLISWITVQAYLHIMSASGFLPQTGIPLPFISYGGSLFVVCL